ncbi:hypothetical protein MUN78_01555 [Leucobacter allii]|uniref:Uncharacterized protein n=1 Tax=Leucobacter allii TaxID=2932247 RepID=A0ABY4FMR0_9MICO|nr:hypothetical protein [Leucobacter allii]UOQ57559.1 hypothetical protein MUN78_01555 [Leucobacter allii]
MTSRSGRRRLRGFAGLVAVALLTGCAAGPGSGGEDLNSDEAIAALGETMHPSGDPGAWFWDAYANGLAGAYSTSDDVCGIGRELPPDLESDDVPGDIVVEARESPGSPRVVGRSLSGGAVMWEVPGSCREGAVVGDTVVVSGFGGANARGSTLVSTRTGRAIMQLPRPDDSAQPGDAVPIRWGAAEDGILDPAAPRLYAVGSDTIMSVSPPDPGAAELEAADPGADPGLPTGTLNWATAIGAEPEAVPLGDGMIGVTHRLNDRIQILDGTSGEIAVDTAVEDVHALTWLSDGYMLRENESDPAYAFYDLDGAEVERTVGDSQYGFAPGPGQGITYTIADQLAGGTTVGVDAAGRPALIEDDDRKNRLRGATVGERDLPDSIIGLRSVSRDGSLLLFSGESGAEPPLPGVESGRAVVIDQRGERVIEWPLAEQGVSVVAGYLLARDGASTHVLLPRRP